MQRYTDYDAFAWLYNREWTAYGSNIFPALQTLAGDKLPTRARVLDLCCGTGQLAKVLVDNGFRVTGIDGSAEMLRYARKNAPGAKFLTADARSFKLPVKQDVVFSTFDALNHVMTLAELEKVFKNVFECLVRGGIFIFDMTTQKHFETNVREYQAVTEKPEYFFTMRTKYDVDTKTLNWQGNLFRRQGELWKRSDFTLYQTWYPIKDIKSGLRKAGFARVKAYDIAPQHEPEIAGDNSVRVFYYAEKPL